MPVFRVGDGQRGRGRVPVTPVVARTTSGALRAFLRTPA